MIEIEHLNKTYPSPGGDIHALRDVNLRIEDGEIFGIIGLSGAGKSTLVRCINLLERPTSGTVRIDGRDMTQLSRRDLLKARQDIGMIFQSFNLLEQRTVLRNICFPLEIAGVKRDEAQARAAELLELVGLSDRAKNYPSQLSGGQKQRVAMAREAVGDDDRILVEPFTGLTVEYAAKRGACAILRGLRAVSDFEYEFQLALMNRRLQRDIQTVFLMTDYQWLFISSTIVKAAASHGADIVGLVPENVRLRLMEKYQRGEVRQATPCLSAPYGGFRVNK